MDVLAAAAAVGCHVAGITVVICDAAAAAIFGWLRPGIVSTCNQPEANG